MSNGIQLRVKLEIVWWVFTAVVIAAFLLPIWLRKVPFPFYVENALFIAMFITSTRYIFLLRHTWLASRFWFKVGIVFAGGIMAFVVITMVSDFNNYIEEVGLQEMVVHLPANKQYPFIRYIQSEMLFFGVGSIIANILLPMRMIMSIWRVRNNTGKV